MFLGKKALRRIEAFLGGFYSVLPMRSIQAIEYQDWYRATSVMRPLTQAHLFQRNATSAYGYFLSLIQLRISPKRRTDEGWHSSWEEYTNWVENNLLECMCACI